MSTSPGPSTPPAPAQPPSGVRLVLGRLGIPSWLIQRPRLPSRNWLIFLSLTGTLAGCYVYDRRECKRIRKEYEDRVRYLAEEPLGSLDLPRKVVVYAARWPGDEDWDRGMRYFRKYVKPILVAAAVDYDMIKGQRHGDVARRIADEVKAHRRALLGLDAPSSLPGGLPPPPTDQSPEAVRRRELEGGLVLVGRATFKEFMAGLRRGWDGSARRVEREEALSGVLADDGAFDEVEEEGEAQAQARVEGEPIPTRSRLPPSGVYSPLQGIASSRPRAGGARSGSGEDEATARLLDTRPERITPPPPMLLVPFTNYLGFRQIPYMLWDVFNERAKVRAGAEAGYKLVMRHTRPFVGPAPGYSPDPPSTSTSETTTEPNEKPPTPLITNSDLDFDLPSESYYKPSTHALPAEIAKARREYYAALPKRLKTARELARGLREPSKDELANPPPTEVELRAERMKKEARWRGDEEGWAVVRPDRGVEWDERFEGALTVFGEGRGA